MIDKWLHEWTLSLTLRRPRPPSCHKLNKRNSTISFRLCLYVATDSMHISDSSSVLISHNGSIELVTSRIDFGFDVSSSSSTLLSTVDAAKRVTFRSFCSDRVVIGGSASLDVGATSSTLVLSEDFLCACDKRVCLYGCEIHWACGPNNGFGRRKAKDTVLRFWVAAHTQLQPSSAYLVHLLGTAFVLWCWNFCYDLRLALLLGSLFELENLGLSFCFSRNFQPNPRVRTKNTVVLCILPDTRSWKIKNTPRTGGWMMSC